MTRRPFGRKREQGMALVGAIVIVTLLFFAGTVMALAVESSMSGVRQVSQDDAVKYAAESAVARGIAGQLQSSPSCPSEDGVFVNGLPLTTWCPALPLSNLSASSPASIRQLAVPGGVIQTNACPPFPQLDADFGSNGAVWTVLGIRRLGATVRLQVSVGGSCGGGSCLTTVSSPGPFAFACTTVTGNNLQLKIQNLGDPVFVGSLVIRAAPAGGADKVAVVVGAAGNEVDEAELLFSQGKPTVRELWHTVLP